MDVLTHTKHDFIHWAPRTHTLLSRIRDFLSALHTAAIHDPSGATRTSAPCSPLCCSKLSWLLSWAQAPAAQLQRREAWLPAKPAPLLPLSCMLHACRAEAAMRPPSLTGLCHNFTDGEAMMKWM